MIILSMSKILLLLKHVFLDGNATEMTLWNELERIYTISSTHAIENLQGKLEALLLKEGEDWAKKAYPF